MPEDAFFTRKPRYRENDHFVAFLSCIQMQEYRELPFRLDSDISVFLCDSDVNIFSIVLRSNDGPSMSKLAHENHTSSSFLFLLFCHRKFTPPNQHSIGTAETENRFVFLFFFFSIISSAHANVNSVDS